MDCVLWNYHMITNAVNQWANFAATRTCSEFIRYFNTPRRKLFSSEDHSLVRPIQERIKDVTWSLYQYCTDPSVYSSGIEWKNITVKQVKRKRCSNKTNNVGRHRAADHVHCVRQQHPGHLGKWVNPKPVLRVMLALHHSSLIYKLLFRMLQSESTYLQPRDSSLPLNTKGSCFLGPNVR